jgi:hypothetical protein
MSDAGGDDDGWQEHATTVGEGVFVLPSSDSTPLLEAVVTAFDDVALAVDEWTVPASVDTGGRAEPWVLTALDLGGPSRDGVQDPPLAKTAADRRTGVRLVGQQPEPGGGLAGVSKAQARKRPGRTMRAHVTVTSLESEVYLWQCPWSQSW